jgi:hypothetical protein
MAACSTKYEYHVSAWACTTVHDGMFTIWSNGPPHVSKMIHTMTNSPRSFYPAQLKIVHRTRLYMDSKGIKGRSAWKWFEGEPVELPSHELEPAGKAKRRREHRSWAVEGGCTLPLRGLRIFIASEQLGTLIFTQRDKDMIGCKGWVTSMIGQDTAGPFLPRCYRPCGHGLKVEWAQVKLSVVPSNQQYSSIHVT